MFVLKHNESFAVFDHTGNMHGRNEVEHDIADGLLIHDTRYLSRAQLTVDGMDPGSFGMTARITGDNSALQCNGAFGGLSLARDIVLWHGALHERIQVTNTGDAARATRIALHYAADFTDLFELRGARRPARGSTQQPVAEKDSLLFAYHGLDDVTRRCAVTFHPTPGSLGAEGTAEFTLRLAPRQTETIYVRAGQPDESKTPPGARSFESARAAAEAHIRQQLRRRPDISSDNADFDRWVRQNAIDIALLSNETSTGFYPCAGIPWYSTPFGRDGIITAMQLLWQDPALALGVLGLLAKWQAQDTNAFHDSEPGKIMHEIRLGEMALCREIPHTPYYGTADATPLFVWLAGMYHKRSGDDAFIRQLWPAIEKALAWIDAYGDRDGDGFVEYQRGADSGLGNQGWKDSHDSISHADGELAAGPIALCEIQGYVYAAKKEAARMAQALGDVAASQRLQAEADQLAVTFNAAFWSEDLGIYAVALDGAKRPCLSCTSNPGHLLLTGIVPQARAEKAIARLMAPDMFTGYGIRTLSSQEKRYEPQRPPEGYHNGTVWVHDTAICAAGFGLYGATAQTAQVMGALFDAARHFPAMRLPELFGGLAREEGQPPAPYPVACNPQAWASASESLLLGAMLGIDIDGGARRLRILHPFLPSFLNELTLRNLRINDENVSLLFQRHGSVTQVSVLEKTAGLTVDIIPAGG